MTTWLLQPSGLLQIRAGFFRIHVKKIALIGSHAAGKTTLSYLLAAHFKIQNLSVKIIQEVARNCPFPLNEQMSKEACLWIYHEHTRKEIEAHNKYDILICDRSNADSFIYALVQNCFDIDDPIMQYSKKCAEYWMHTYDKIFYVKPTQKKIPDDGFRSIDKQFQLKVEKAFDEWIAHRLDKFNVIALTTDDIISNKFLEYI